MCSFQINYLLPKFLGVLGYFDQRLLNPYVTDDSKREILRSLCDIVRFMGPRGVANVKHKLMATFKTAATAVRLSDINRHLFNLWDAFVRTMEVSSLAPILPQVNWFISKYMCICNF